MSDCSWLPDLEEEACTVGMEANGRGSPAADAPSVRSAFRGPLYNMGAQCPEGQSEFDAQPVEEYDQSLLVADRHNWFWGCDKLRLMTPTMPDVCDSLGLEWSDWRPARARGNVKVEGRWVKHTLGSAPVVFFNDRVRDAVQDEFRVEFSPLKVGRAMMEYGLRGLLDRVCEGVAGGVASIHVERFDTCWDAYCNPYSIRVVPGRHKLTMHGVTRRGAQTEEFGLSMKGSKFGVRKYDRWAKVGNKGVLPTRVESVVRGPGLRLGSLATAVWPWPEGTGVVKLMDPVGVTDVRFKAVLCVAIVEGVVPARAAARELLGSRAPQADFVLWDDITEQLEAAWGRQWPQVVRKMLEPLGVTVRLPASADAA